MANKYSLYYTIPDGVNKEMISGHPVLTTTQGGKIVVDSTLLALWECANGHTIAEIEKSSSQVIFNQIILAAPDIDAKVFKEKIFRPYYFQ